MSALSPRPFPQVISLTLHVSEEGIIRVELRSLVPPRTPGARKCCGGVLRTRRDSPLERYAVVQGRYTGKWGFPKGKMEAGETELACAIREVAEEVGVGGLSAPVCRIPVSSQQVYFLFDVEEEMPLHPIDILEVAETRWMEIEEMKGLNNNAGMRGVLSFLSRKKQE